MDKKKAREMYPLPWEQFSVGAKVQVKKLQEVIREFNTVERLDFSKWKEAYCQKTEEVSAWHPTNDVSVKFSDGKQFGTSQNV